MASSLVRSSSRLLPRAGVAARMGSRAFPSYLLNAPATEVGKLDNGMRVASEFSHTETATIGVFVDTGSRYETGANNGVAHFLEHLAFKGTGKRSRMALEKEIENMGGHLNAYTSREMTVYYAKVFKKDVPAAVEIMGDILTNSTFDAAAVESERGVILREMEEIEKTYEEAVFDRLHETAYRGTGLARTILGPEKNIRGITRDDIVSFVKQHYTAPRMVLAGAGGVEAAQLMELGAKHFGGLPAAAEGAAAPSDKAHFTGSDLRVRFDDMELAHVTVAVETEGWTSAHAFDFMVMQSLLGSWNRASSMGAHMASPLCRAIAQQELAHSVTAFNTTYTDTGLFGVYFVCGDTNVHDCTWHTMNNLTRLCHEVTDEEVARARTQLKASMLSGLEDSAAVCEDIGRQMLVYGRRMTPAELVMRIDAVSADAVKKTATKFIDDADVAVAAMGPIYEMPDYNWIRRRTHRLRH